MAGAILRLAHPRYPQGVMTPIQDEREPQRRRGGDPRMAHPSTELRKRLTSKYSDDRRIPEHDQKDSRTICSQHGSQGPKSGQS